MPGHAGLPTSLFNRSADTVLQVAHRPPPHVHSVPSRSDTPKAKRTLKPQGKKEKLSPLPSGGGEKKQPQNQNKRSSLISLIQ